MDSTVRLFQQKNVKASNVQQCGTRNMLKIVYVIIFQVSPTSGLSRFDLRMLPNHIKKEPRRESLRDRLVNKKINQAAPPRGSVGQPGSRPLGCAY